MIALQTFDPSVSLAVGGDTFGGGDRGSHAVTIIGYNDTLTTHDGPGAFKMINSWGTGWGQSGFWWMSYVAARNANRTAQAGYDLQQEFDFVNGKLFPYLRQKLQAGLPLVGVSAGLMLGQLGVDRDERRRPRRPSRTPSSRRRRRRMRPRRSRPSTRRNCTI